MVVNNIEIGSLPFKYLSMPITSSKLKVNYCKPLIDKILGRITFQRSKLLSYASRLILIKFILFCIQVYWSSIFILPSYIYKEIDSYIKVFLQSGTSLNCKKAKVAQDEVCVPKEESRLGIMKNKSWNKVVMVKHMWTAKLAQDEVYVPKEEGGLGIMKNKSWNKIIMVKHTWKLLRFLSEQQVIKPTQIISFSSIHAFSSLQILGSSCPSFLSLSANLLLCPTGLPPKANLPDWDLISDYLFNQCFPVFLLLCFYLSMCLISLFPMSILSSVLFFSFFLLLPSMVFFFFGIVVVLLHLVISCVLVYAFGMKQFQVYWWLYQCLHDKCWSCGVIGGFPSVFLVVVCFFGQWGAC